MYARILTEGLQIKEVTPEEMNAVLDLHFAKVYANRSDELQVFTPSDEALAKIKERKSNNNRYMLRLVAYKNNEPVGWHYGYATDAEVYYMQNSAVIETARNQGIYGALLDAVIEKLGLEGFQVITSTHHTNNAPILIPKLKKGFIISGVTFHERFRFLLEMRYFFNTERRQAYNKKLGLDLP
ncbi:hypothetical protein D3C87_1353520 [compost metagenome]